MELKHFGSENFCFLHGDFVTHITSSLPCVAAQWKGNNPWSPASSQQIFLPRSRPWLGHPAQGRLLWELHARMWSERRVSFFQGRHPMERPLSLSRGLSPRAPGLSPRAPGAVRVPQGWPRAARWRCGVAFPRSGMAREWFGISGWIEPLRPLISRFLKCSCHSSSDRLPPFPEGHLSFTGPADVLPCVLIPQVLKRCNVVWGQVTFDGKVTSVKAKLTL